MAGGGIEPPTRGKELAVWGPLLPQGDRLDFHMPQMTKLAKDKVSARRSATHAGTSWAWVTDPLARWQQHFDAWRMKIGDFREWEKEAFFQAPDTATLRRAHLGWVCQLIAEGQQLAVELTGAKRPQRGQLRNLDNFLDNLRATFLVWHAPEAVSQNQNPLAKYFD